MEKTPGVRASFVDSVGGVSSFYSTSRYTFGDLLSEDQVEDNHGHKSNRQSGKLAAVVGR